jgi:predicted Na+-dependent transporter
MNGGFDMKHEVKSVEFITWAVGSLVAVLIPLLIAYGVITAELGQLWIALISVVSAIVIPVVVGSLTKNYADNRTARVTAAMNLETARLIDRRVKE